ncbi:hypothetical protein MMC20_007859 [Loxospora ochrophaea]|nr:hypothetical protein [Loxospora ochrophaea]
METPAPVTLESLPNEVLDRVFVFAKLLEWGLYKESQRPSILTQISLVCHRFGNLAARVRYQNVRLQLFSDDVWERDERQFKSLVSTLRTRPDLCALVRGLGVILNVSENGDELQKHNQLLDLLPSLQELGLAPPVLNVPLQSYQRLKTLHLHCKRSRLPTKEIIPLVTGYFFLPSLRTLSIYEVHFHNEDFDKHFARSRSFSQTSGLTTLTICRTSRDCLQVLPIMLPFLPFLRHLTVETNHYVHRPEKGTVSLSALASALQAYTSTLETLSIELDGRADLSGSFRSFTSFRCLTRLSVSELFLESEGVETWHELLPAQLEQLIVQSPQNSRFQPTISVFDSVAKLAMYHKASLPVLECVVLWAPFGLKINGMKIAWSYFADAKRTFRKSDVEFIYAQDMSFADLQLRSWPVELVPVRLERHCSTQGTLLHFY